MNYEEEREMIMKINEITYVISELKTENKLLKQENEYLKKLIEEKLSK